MKNAILKTVFSSLLLLGTSSICHAKPEHRISIGAGVLSYIYINEICDEHADVELAPPYFGGNKIIGYSTYEYAWRDLQSLPITANLHYECTLGKHFGIGLCVGYEHQKMDLDINVYTYTGEKIWETRQTIFLCHARGHNILFQERACFDVWKASSRYKFF